MLPGADADRTEASYAVLGAPLDVSTSFQPGARFGPSRVRDHTTHFDDYDHLTDLHFTDLAVYDHGDVGPTADVAEYLDYLAGTLSDFRREGAMPILVGGEHTVTVAGVRAVDPDVYVCLDAHLDLRESYAGDPLSHATVTHHALEIADRAVIVGARTGSKAEWARANEGDVTVIPPEEAGDWSPEFEGSVYCSVDVDAFEPAAAPGTGTPEPFGLTPQVGKRLVRELAPQAEGFDVVEVNDRDDGQAALLAGKLLRRFVYDHAADQ